MRETVGMDFCLSGMQDVFRRSQIQASIVKKLGGKVKELMFYLVVNCLRSPLKDFESRE